MKQPSRRISSRSSSACTATTGASPPTSTRQPASTPQSSSPSSRPRSKKSSTSCSRTTANACPRCSLSGSPIRHARRAQERPSRRQHPPRALPPVPKSRRRQIKSWENLPKYGQSLHVLLKPLKCLLDLCSHQLSARFEKILVFHLLPAVWQSIFFLHLENLLFSLALAENWIII